MKTATLDQLVKVFKKNGGKLTPKEEKQLAEAKAKFPYLSGKTKNEVKK